METAAAIALTIFGILLSAILIWAILRARRL